MRKILFRGVEVGTGKWRHGDLIHGVGSKHGKMYILPISEFYPEGCDDLNGWELISETVGQFTGLTDGYGEDIYEGDILSYDYFDCTEIDDWMKKAHYIVTVKEYSLAMTGVDIDQKRRMFLHAFRFPYAEVVGNIHDNPELINTHSNV